MIVLSNMVTPRIEREAESRNYGKYLIGPLERGYGNTLGNALRRVLLASLEGTAITSIRITDVQHEYSDIPGIREDVIQIMLQLKQLRMKIFDVDSARLHMEVRGEGVVTAADIIAPPEVEIVNPDLYLFTSDSSKTKLEIEMSVERGRGYSPANDRSGRLPIGELPVDAIFTPVKQVNWDVGYARVGQSTNYDRLEMEIWTDGTVAPEESMSTAAGILIEHLRHIAGVTEISLTPVPVEVDMEARLTSEIYETPIENLDLSVRVFNSLKRAGIVTVGEVLELLEKGEDAIMSIRNFGDKSMDELVDKMSDKGYLKSDEEETAETEAE
ncbi:MAG: DNA-directed RNA polymerase subunit alpha [Chloroflexi bacterium]|jgi:DNA-directed RNA polymerase subunit alpha|nr:DNA-directed RNA polymerase subunit alpha [Chloroflexota bacterium]MBT3669331.1 DNA-directed RNA polymerase subunit alpha [Chloroflexota bacterium]MBT4003470.1 DNA-directed RNA polymerase subunit alpha [Chloroflexota bacterium]MBT4306038.1 DNA-directed RNA polymerase subunit alpha [Chloroflexota bacterium]MBT4532682.1 DNA-directed RNA polymerase subunit alpha [Chloroflexota bacterium]